MEIPCDQCLIFPMCKARYTDLIAKQLKRYTGDNFSLAQLIDASSVITLASRCSLITRYMYKTNRESDRRELIERNGGANIEEVFVFYRKALE